MQQLTTKVPPRVATTDDHLQQARREVANVTALMKQNMSKVLERDEHLTDLKDKAEALKGM